MGFKDWIEEVAKAIDVAGVAAVVGGLVLATVLAVVRGAPREALVYSRPAG